jgi:hypothetical protein
MIVNCNICNNFRLQEPYLWFDGKLRKRYWVTAVSLSFFIYHVPLCNSIGNVISFWKFETSHLLVSQYPTGTAWKCWVSMPSKYLVAVGDVIYFIFWCCWLLMTAFEIQTEHSWHDRDCPHSPLFKFIVTVCVTCWWIFPGTILACVCCHKHMMPL